MKVLVFDTETTGLPQRDEYGKSPSLYDTKKWPYIIQFSYILYDTDKNKSKGGGGTAFEPAFEWADKNLKPKDISVFLYFTDLYGDTSFKRPKWHHKVIWVLEKDSRDLDVPWGKKLVLDSNFKIK